MLIMSGGRPIKQEINIAAIGACSSTRLPLQIKKDSYFFSGLRAKENTEYTSEERHRKD